MAAETRDDLQRTGPLLLAVLVALVLFGRAPRRRALLFAMLLGLALVLVPTRLVPAGWPPGISWRGSVTPRRTYLSKTVLPLSPRMLPPLP